METNMNYKSEYLNALENNIKVRLHAIDCALDTCLNDYYDACETSNMLGDTMKLLASVQKFSSTIKHDNERDDTCMLMSLIVEGMRGREGEYLEKYSDDAVWNQYVETLEENMNLELDRREYELGKFIDDVKIYNHFFDANWVEE